MHILSAKYVSIELENEIKYYLENHIILNIQVFIKSILTISAKSYRYIPEFKQIISQRYPIPVKH